MVQLTPPPARVLVADSEATSRRELARALLETGLEVLTSESAEAALALARSERIDVALVGGSLRTRQGEALLAGLRRLPSPPEVIAVAGVDEEPEALLAQGAWGVVEKGPRLATLAITAARRASEQRRLAAEVRRQQGSEDELLGHHRGLRQARLQAEQAAASGRPVHLWGEAGAGKRALARHIHQLRGASRPWVELPGALASEELLRDERAFDRARGGVLYVSEVDALSTSAQLLLEKWIDSRESSTQLITSARNSLFRASQTGAFRPELYARVAVQQIHLPPLRQRKDDIPLLAHHFLLQATQRNQRPVKRIGPEAMRQLRAQPWPGNIRELKLTIERAVLSCDRDSLFPGDLTPPSDPPDSPPKFEFKSL